MVDVLCAAIGALTRDVRASRWRSRADRGRGNSAKRVDGRARVTVNGMSSSVRTTVYAVAGRRGASVAILVLCARGRRQDLAATAKRVHAAVSGAAVGYMVSNASHAAASGGAHVVGTGCHVVSGTSVVVGTLAARGAVGRVKVDVRRRRRRAVFGRHVVVATLLVMRRVGFRSMVRRVVVVGRFLGVVVVRRSSGGRLVAVVVGGIKRFPLVVILVGIILHGEAKASKGYKSKGPVLGRGTDTRSLNAVLRLVLVYSRACAVVEVECGVVE